MIELENVKGYYVEPGETLTSYCHTYIINKTDMHELLLYVAEIVDEKTKIMNTAYNLNTLKITYRAPHYYYWFKSTYDQVYMSRDEQELKADLLQYYKETDVEKYNKMITDLFE